MFHLSNSSWNRRVDATATFRYEKKSIASRVFSWWSQKTCEFAEVVFRVLLFIPLSSSYSNNHLDSIPEQICELNLVELDLSNNNLVSIWVDISKWDHLEKLSLNNNKLESLPASLKYFIYFKFIIKKKIDCFEFSGGENQPDYCYTSRNYWTCWSDQIGFGSQQNPRSTSRIGQYEESFNLGYSRKPTGTVNNS